MAILFDQNLGSNDANTSTTIALTTSQTAAAGSRIFVFLSAWNGNAACNFTTVNDGSAYAKDKNSDNGNDFFEIWSRDCPAGLASGSTITATLTSATGAGGVLIGAVSFTGILSSGALDTTAVNTTTGTGWSSGAATNTNAAALFIGGAGNECAATSVAFTAINGTKIHDRWRTADAQGFGTAYTIASSVASRSVSGTWASTSTATTGALCIYTAAAGGGAVPASPVLDPQIQWTEDFGPGDEYGPNPFQDDMAPLLRVPAPVVVSTLRLLSSTGVGR